MTSAPVIKFDEESGFLDITGAGDVEIKIRADGGVVWVNASGCKVRICQIAGHITVEDERRRAARAYRSSSPRPQILAALADGPRTAAQLAEAIGISLWAAQQQAKSMSRAGLVRKVGQVQAESGQWRALWALPERAEEAA